METVGRNWESKAKEFIVRCFSCRERERFCSVFSRFYYIGKIWFVFLSPENLVRKKFQIRLL